MKHPNHSHKTAPFGLIAIVIVFCLVVALGDGDIRDVADSITAGWAKLQSIGTHAP